MSKLIAYHKELQGAVIEDGGEYLLAGGGITEEFSTLHEALEAWADLNLTESDCKAWHNGKLTRRTSARVDVIVAELGMELEIWGLPEGPEPLWVIVR